MVSFDVESLFTNIPLLAVDYTSTSSGLYFVREPEHQVKQEQS